MSHASHVSSLTWNLMYDHINTRGSGALQSQGAPQRLASTCPLAARLSHGVSRQARGQVEPDTDAQCTCTGRVRHHPLCCCSYAPKRHSTIVPSLATDARWLSSGLNCSLFTVLVCPVTVQQEPTSGSSGIACRLSRSSRRSTWQGVPPAHKAASTSVACSTN